MASSETCQFIESVAPYPVEVSVTNTSQAVGEIDVTWTKPINVDETLFPKPWTYRLARAEGLTGTTNYTDLGVVFAEDDTTFGDTGLNTEELAYNYRVLFFSQGNLVDSSQVASSVRLTATPAPAAIRLSWEADVPWSNTTNSYRFHYIYREDNDNPGTFFLIDSVDVVTNGLAYTDNGTFNNIPLEDSEEYCYYVTTIGSYEFDAIRDSLVNHSQEMCAIVLDSVPPCPPILSIETLDCNIFEPRKDHFTDCSLELEDNILTWVDSVSPDCEDDIQFYRLYVTDDESLPYELLADSIPDRTYIDADLLNNAKCYYVTAVDDFGNESVPSNIVCGVNCPFYELPNAFSPNGDGINDLFIPIRCPRFVRRVEFTVYNRWGKLVYESTDNIDLEWNGKNKNGSVLPSGTYFYHAKVFFYTFEEGDIEEERKGTIHLFTSGDGSGG